MQKPRSLGVIVLIYAFAAHLFGVIGATGFLTMSHKPFENNGAYILVIISALPLFLLPLYLAGGVGLLFLRRWAADVILAAASADIVRYGLSAISLILFSGKSTAAGVDPITPFSMLFSLTGMVMPGSIALFSFWLRSENQAFTSPSAGMRTDDVMQAEQKDDRSSTDTRYRFLFRGMIASGMVLPWLVGIGVHLYLSAHGKPTLPWSYFINIGSILIFIPFTLSFALSYIMLAYVGRIVLSKPILGLESSAATMAFILGGFAGGVIGTLRTFIDVFWEFDFLYFLAPLWALNIPYMLAGCIAGLLIGKGYEKFFRK
jgi:hypothetical protein